MNDPIPQSGITPPLFLENCPGVFKTVNYDVIVAGGGTAGSAAAIAAGRDGKKVLLFEEANALGGVSTTGGVHEWFANTSGLGNIFDAVHRELTQYGARHGRFFNGEYLKIVWQRLAEAANVDILFHTTLMDVVCDNGQIKHANLLSCGRIIQAHATAYIDATGEGDLAAMTGAPFMRGDPATGRTLHMTLTFLLADSGREQSPYLPEGLEPINSDQDLPGLGTGMPTPDNRVYCNATKVMGLDPTDPFDLTKAELEGRRQIARIVHYLQRTKYPRHVLVSSGGRIGIREGRRILGDCIINGHDVVAGRDANPPDGIAVATSQIDFHSLTKPGYAGWRQKVPPYAIPLRAMTPQNLRNVLVAGKPISGDQIAMSSYRMTPTCCAMGQAAGVAAAMYVEDKLSDFRSLNVQTLRQRLIAADAVVDPAGHKPFATHQTPDPADAV